MKADELTHEDQHKRQKQIDEDKTGKVPPMAPADCFPWETSEDSEKKHPILGIVCRKSGNIGAVKCKSKGARDLYVVGCVVNFIRVLGLSEGVSRCDPEASTMQIARKVQGMRSPLQTVPRASPKESKGLFGLAEGAHTILEG